MPDVYLYAGEVTPGDVRLSDPTVPRGWWPGASALTEEQNLSARGQVSPWGVVLYPMGALIASGGALASRPIGSAVIRRLDR